MRPPHRSCAPRSPSPPHRPRSLPTPHTSCSHRCSSTRASSPTSMPMCCTQPSPARPSHSDRPSRSSAQPPSQSCRRSPQSSAASPTPPPHRSCTQPPACPQLPRHSHSMSALRSSSPSTHIPSSSPMSMPMCCMRPRRATRSHSCPTRRSSAQPPSQSCLRSKQS